MDATITRLTDTDTELCNILWAYGPGQGLMRMLVIVRDAASITVHGEYPRAVTISDAVDRADLTAKAQTRLNALRVPLQQLTVEVPVTDADPRFTVGDLLPIANEEDGIYLEARVRVLERQTSAGGDVYTLSFGDQLPSLLDHVLGINDEDDRRARELGLPPPVVRVLTANPGLSGTVQVFPDSLATYHQIHASTDGAFTPDRGSLRIDRLTGSRFTLGALTPHVRWFVRAVSFDRHNNPSNPSEVVSAIAGALRPSPGTVGITELASGIVPPRIVHDILPVLPHADFPAGTVIFLVTATERRLFITDEGTTWRPMVDRVGAVTATHFASGIRPVGIGGALPAHPYTGLQQGDLFMHVVGGVSTMHRLTNPAATGTAGWTVAIATQDIQLGAVNADRIAANAVTATAILAGAVTAGKIAAGAISATEIAANAITSPAIAAGAVTAEKIAANTITAGQIAAGAIGATQIAANAVTSDKVAANSIATRHLIIGDPSNIFPDQPLRDTANWPIMSWVPLDDPAWAHGRALYSVAPPPTGQDHAARPRAIPVEPGAQYFIQCQAWSEFAGNHILLIVRFATPAPATYHLIGGNTNAPAGWLTLSGIITTPASAHELWIHLVRNPGGSGFVAVGNFIVRRAIDERLVAQLGASTRVDHQGLRTRDGGGVVRAAMGDLGGLMWGTETLPPGTFGFHGSGANIYLADYPRLVFSGQTAANLTRNMSASLSQTYFIESPWLNLPAPYQLAAGRRIAFHQIVAEISPVIMGQPFGTGGVFLERYAANHLTVATGVNGSGHVMVVHPARGPRTISSIRVGVTVRFFNNGPARDVRVDIDLEAILLDIPG